MLGTRWNVAQQAAVRIVAHKQHHVYLLDLGGGRGQILDLEALLLHPSAFTRAHASAHWHHRSSAHRIASGQA